MINKIIHFSVHNKMFIFMATFLLIILGVKSFKELSIDAVPDITNTQVQINTRVKGLVPEEVERMVTFPIEYSMNGIPGVETIRSISRYGISQVTVIFNEQTDIFRARQLVSEKLQKIDLPKDLMPEMGPISTGLGEIFHYSLDAIKPEQDPKKRLVQLMELRALQDWFIKPRLLTVRGVNEVNTMGGFEKQFYIQPDIEKMTKFGIDFEDIEIAIENTNLNVGGGYIQQTGEQLLVRGVGLLHSIQDIENVIVKRNATYEVIKIKDIANVDYDKEIRTGAALVDGHEAVVGSAMMLLGENSRTVAQNVGLKIKEIQKDLPSWVKLNVLYDRSNMVNATLGTVEHNLLMGAALVIIFLLLLVGNLRAAIITSLIIPISLLMTFILMKWQNVSGNLMSLGALDFGIIVDGAVIVIENCVHRIQQKGDLLNRELTRSEVKEVVIDSTVEIRSAAGFGELIVITVFVPLFALTGVEGKMFAPMATTFIMALCSALLLSFTIVPALAATFLSGKTKDKKPFLMAKAESLFKPTLEKALKIKKIILGIGIASIVLGVLLFSRLGSEFIPELDEGDFAIQFMRPANISVESSVELQKVSDKVILSFPQVAHVFTRMGTAEIASDPMGPDDADSYIMLKNINEWPKDTSIQNKQDLIRKIVDKLEENVPGQSLMVTQPVALRFNELLEGVRAEVSVKIFGDDLDKLINYSKEIAEIVNDIEDSGEAESESKGKTPMIQYEPKLEELAQFGLTARPVLDTINTAIGGREVGVLYEGVKRFPIVTRLSDKQRKDVLMLRKLPVGISESYTVPVEKVANIKFIETFTSVLRENSQRRVAVLINPETRDIESFVNKAKNLVEEKVKLPEGYYIEWGGSFKNLQSAKKRLGVLVPMALLIIVGMLYAAFKNYAQVILIFACAPMSLIGGVISLNLMGMPFSISAGVGFIALSGISILNGVVLITYFNRLLEEGKTPDEVVKEGAMTRLRPVLMTALTDIFGFLPMMFSAGLGAEVQKPLATVVVGGIISATLLTLIVIPSLYRLFIKNMKQV